MTSLDGEKLLDYYLKLYFYELEHREAINSRLAHHATVLSLLGAALIFLLDHRVPSAAGQAYDWWVGLLSLGTLGLLIGIGATALAWWGFRYQFASDPNALEEWRRGMRAKGFDSTGIGQHLFQNVLAQVAGVTAHNRGCNRSKSRRAAAGRLAILFAAVAYGSALIPFAVTNQGRNDSSPAPGVNQTMDTTSG